MPAQRELMSKPEVGLRRTDVTSRRGNVGGRPGLRAQGVGGNGTLQSARGRACENTNPCIDSKNRQNSTFGSCAGSINKRTNSGLGGPALADITNVAAGWGPQMDKAKPKQNQSTLTIAADVPAVSTIAVAVETVPAVDVQVCEEYADEIVNQFFLDEALLLPRADYMDTQTDITPKMRTILIDWLVEVHMKYRLRAETLHLTVNLIDRYLTKMPVMRKRLQLVGVVAMFIASKYEEIRPPELHEWVYITDNAYKKEDLLNLECNMLTTLSFQIMVPTAANFFDFLHKVNSCDAVHSDLAQYIVELGLLDIRMLQHTPSQVVAAALLLSNELLKRNSVWSATMVQHSRNSETALRGCADVLRQLLEADRAGAGGQLQAVHKKFSTIQRHAVAVMKF